MKAIMEYVPEYIYFKDLESRFIRVNFAQAQNFGFSDPQEMAGRTDFDFFTRENAQTKYADEQMVIKTGQSISKEEEELWTDKPKKWLLTTKMPLSDAEGNIIGTFGISKDITDRKNNETAIQKLLDEKELILQEVHHRIKNNMNTIKSVISLQAGSTKDLSSIRILKDAESRIQSMMILYEKLYQSASHNTVSAKDYFSSLVDDIVANFPNSRSVKIEKRIDDFVLDAKKMQPLGIIINELLTNIMKYAFIARTDGLITVSAALEGNVVSLLVGDNGNGMPESVNFQNSNGLGIKLVGMLSRQLGGCIRIERGNGTRIILEFEI
jgi:PAS domain S-box-containing protein